MKRFVTALLSVIFVFALFALVLPSETALAYCGGSGECETATPSIYDKLNDLFFPGESSCNINEQVYLGGYPIGITIDGNGVTVIGLNEFFDESGLLCCPALDAGIEINDTIVELDGKKIYNSAKLTEIAAASDGKPVKVKYLRDEKIEETEIVPRRDITGRQFRLGLWTRDTSSGVGTLTYVRKNLQFGSLGHPICDNKGNIVQCKNGGIFKCTINGIVKGQKGAAGELKGGFSFENRIGTLYANNKFGAFGNFTALPSFCKDSVSVASVGEVKPGKAVIYSTLDDNERKSYDIEIVKVTQQTSRDDKGMVIRVTDKELLAKTGGIVQGMSGSPIVQNGKLVGAVTHVFVNDPTRGYGMFAQWMLTN